ncbi:protein ELYS isoform X2 [Galleria mellonella]|uniref:Protein ELYS isoform X2 n=1 Tax=Galleria mellonella TaxID=7137 RepID=A0ABM3MFQ6_GALME|nr:protein ELYS isoform X2 [Galleria mellonella]
MQSLDMQKVEDSVFSVIKTTGLSPAVFNFLQPSEDSPENYTPLGGILNDTKHGWLALGPKFCVVDLRTGLKIAAKIFGNPYGNSHIIVTSVVELPSPITNNSQQLLISLQCEDGTGMICIFHVNGSQVLRCIQSEVVITQLAVSDGIPDGYFTCFDGVVMAGTKNGEIFVFDLNRACLIQALKDISQGYEHLIQGEQNPANLTFLSLSSAHRLEEQRDIALENDDHIAVLLNENSLMDGQYLFRNPDGTIRMKAKRDHVRVTVLQYIPQLASLAVGYNFGAFQIWNMITMELEFTSQVNVECLPVTHFGFQEPCDDPRAFCYLWVVFSVIDRFEEEEFPLAVMYSLTYQGKRMLSHTKCLYQDFTMATIRFQVELSTMEDSGCLVGGKCVSCNTYSINSTMGDDGEDSTLNICQLVWECWGENANSSSVHGMLLFDLDQWYKDQMPATRRVESCAFLSAAVVPGLSGGGAALDVKLLPDTVAPYHHATRLEEHFYPNSLQYECACLSTSEWCVVGTAGVQRALVGALAAAGPAALLRPAALYRAARAAGLAPPAAQRLPPHPTQEQQRRFLLCVALEARLARLLARVARDWSTHTHAAAGCTLDFLVDWCWDRALELKENARELTAPLFVSSALPDRNVIRCLEHCVQQLTQLTGLLDAVLTKCCSLVVPDALSEIEEKYKAIGTVSLYFQVVQWFLRVGLLPERLEHGRTARLHYPAHTLQTLYDKRRLKLNRLDNSAGEDNSNKSCSLLYIDQLIEKEFGGERIHQMWRNGGSETGLYPPPSLYSLLRLYLLPDVPDEHKHSLVLYLLVDYSSVYDDVRYEEVIRRLMQFPTMFGLSNTAIKATQAFWHLDHRDFDFALDNLQCLTGNTLSEWQHNVVLSSLLAQKKTQAALQYLHVRKPAPVQLRDDGTLNSSRVNDLDKLEDWQSCCNLYLARNLVFEALDVVRMCVQNTAKTEEKEQVLNFFFKGCRNTGQLSKILQVTLLPFEEKVFIKYLEDCNESQTGDILITYYLQHARYLEAEQYNNKLKQSKARSNDVSASAESLAETLDREEARDNLVELAMASLPAIAGTVAKYALVDKDYDTHIIAPKPMSVYIQAKSPKNTFTYKSSFIQDTIENASETWINKPKMRRGIKRALNIEETPFICTPKLSKTRSVMEESQEGSPPKRARREGGTARAPGGARVSAALGEQLAALLHLPEQHTPPRAERQLRADTPHSILKVRHAPRTEGAGEQLAALLHLPEQHTPPRAERQLRADTPHSILKVRHAPRTEGAGEQLAALLHLPEQHTPPRAERQLRADTPHSILKTRRAISDDELDNASMQTQYSDSNKFTIPTASECGSTPSTSPVAMPTIDFEDAEEMERSVSAMKERDEDNDDYYNVTEAEESHKTTQAHSMDESHVLESPPKKLATEDDIKTRKFYKDTVRARRSLSLSANSSLSDDPNSTVESIADIPITLINPRYSSSRRRSVDETEMQVDNDTDVKERNDNVSGVVPRTPKSRRGIRAVSEITPRVTRSRSCTPERQDSPAVELRATRTTRSRSRTPERIIKESPRLEPITESPVKSSKTVSSSSSPSRRSLRSRSRTPEVEVITAPDKPASPRNLRSRAKTPEKSVTPKLEHSAKTKKSLSRLVLEANAFAKSKLNLENNDLEESHVDKSDVIECTPMKTLKQMPSLLDVTLSPIVNKSVLQSSADSVLSETIHKYSLSENKNTTDLGLKTLPAFTTLHETGFEKSVLRSYQSSMADTSESIVEEKRVEVTHDITTNVDMKSLPAFTTVNDIKINKSLLHSYDSSVANSPQSEQEETDVIKTQETIPKLTAFTTIDSDIYKSVLRSHESSMAETSQEISMSKDPSSSKNVSVDKSAWKDVSSLMTSDSDMDVRDDNKDSKIESQDTAIVIQKEKERIVEIEREINEIEGDMSDDSLHVSEDTDTSDEEILQGEDSGATSEADTSSSDESAASGSDEIISIKDTESDDSSTSDDRLQINEETSTEANQQDQLAQPIETEPQVTVDVQVEKEEDSKIEVTEGSTDPLNQAHLSLLTDDNSIVESDQSRNLNFSNEVIEVDKEKLADVHTGKEIIRENVTESVGKVMETDEQPAVTIEVTIEKTPDNNVREESVAKETNVVDSIAVEISDVKPKRKLQDDKLEEKSEESENTPMQIDVAIPKDKETSKDYKQINIDKKVQEDDSSQKKNEITITEENMEIDIEKPITKGRKRAKSTSSNKSFKEAEVTDNKEEKEIKTPPRRKRTSSTASNKSVVETEPKMPENVQTEEVSTPTRRRAKTPTSAEIRKIITRRVSREMAAQLDQSKDNLDVTVATTPKRRTTRAKSKNADDNESIASGSSVISIRSTVSEEVGDVKPAPIRKGRRSVLATKTDLSVIPETTTEESTTKSNEDLINEYSSSRRLTRHQKTVLESWLEPVGSPDSAGGSAQTSAGGVGTSRRTSTSTITSITKDDDDASSTHSAGFDVQPIDRISLLNKPDFEGSPDREELYANSPDPFTTDACSERRSRLTRAASESRQVVKAAKISRRIHSADIDMTPERGSPVPAGASSPARGRRASFNRACEALHTPKGRRTSTDLRKGETDSPLGSEAASELEVVTPARRPRRASTQSNTSQAKSETGKRSKKMSTVEESNDSNK